MISLGRGASEGAVAREGYRCGAVCPRAGSAGLYGSMCSGLRVQLCFCRTSLSSRRVNGHHPWIRITRVICGQDPEHLVGMRGWRNPAREAVFDMSSLKKKPVAAVPFSVTGLIS